MALDVKALSIFRDAEIARQKLAKSMLDGFAANAFEKPAAAEDIAYWEAELADATAELAAMDHA